MVCTLHHGNKLVCPTLLNCRDIPEGFGWGTLAHTLYFPHSQTLMQRPKDRKWCAWVREVGRSMYVLGQQGAGFKSEGKWKMCKSSISHMDVSKLSTLQRSEGCKPHFYSWGDRIWEGIVICQSHIVNGWDSNSGVIFVTLQNSYVEVVTPSTWVWPCLEVRSTAVIVQLRWGYTGIGWAANLVWLVSL